VPNKEIPVQSKTEVQMSGDSGSFFGLGGVPASEDVVETSVWSFSGRIGRGDFWRRSVMIGALAFTSTFVIGLWVSSNTSSIHDTHRLTTMLCMPFNIAFGLFLLATQVKRWHDLNYSGWISLINFVPQTAYMLLDALVGYSPPLIGVAAIALSLFVLIFLGFIKGTKGRNHFGADPVA
jgi:uncharacterized membrane protein YhaH (DUF805 family)